MIATIDNPKRITDPKECLNYLTAGKCKVTLKSLISGIHFTYKITVQENPKYPDYPLYFVKVLMCGDSGFNYIGYIFKSRTTGEWSFGKKADISDTAKSVLAFTFLLKLLNKGKMNDDLEILKSSSCCKCGKTLTTPESIQDGIGPECKKFLTKKGKW